MLRLVLVLVLVTLVGCKRSSETAPPAADLVLLGGRIRTLDPERPLADALAISKGRVVAVGTEIEIRRFIGPTTRQLHLDGATALPGLVDAHLHLEGLGSARRRLDLRGVSLTELEARLERAVQTRTSSAPVLGRGWDQSEWTTTDCGYPPCLDAHGFPLRTGLDRLAPDRPVVLRRVDGHAAFVNGAALALAGIDAHTRDPEGGRIVRDEAGHPTGVLIDNAVDLVTRRLPAPDADEIRASVLAAQSELLSLGLVAVHDMGTSPEVLAVLRELDAGGELALRVYAYLWGQDAPSIAELAAAARPYDGRRLKVVGVKLMADGALGSRGASLLENYADADHAGALLLPGSALEARIQATWRAGLAPAVHAIGDRANRLVLDIFAQAPSGAVRAPARLEHAQILSAPDRARLAPASVVASMQPTHATSDLRWAQARLGVARLEGAYAWQSLRVAGATLAFGSDAPVESADPRAGLYAAVTRMDQDGKPEGGWLPKERLSMQDALRGFTRGAWLAVGEEGGILKPGCAAHLSVLSVDPMDAPPRRLLDAEVRATIVDGEVVYDRLRARGRP